MIELIREEKGATLVLEGNKKELEDLRGLIIEAGAHGECEKIKIKNTVGAKVGFRFRLKGYKPEPEDIDDLLS